MYTVIAKVNCPWCVKAEDAICEKFGRVNIISLEEEPWLRTIMLEADLKTVPQIITPDGQLIRGYESLVQHLLEA